MPVATTAMTPHPADRLRAMLESLRPAIDEEMVAEARAIGPEAAVELITAKVEQALAPGFGPFFAIRAVRLAGELHLERAAPVIARCLAVRRGRNELWQAALGALTLLGRPGAEALLVAFERCPNLDERQEMAELVADLDTCEERVRVALLAMVDDLPECGARLLVRRGDWRAVPELLRRIDRLAAEPPADCALCTSLDLETLRDAVHTLGGVVTDDQEERIREVVERGEDEIGPRAEFRKVLPRRPHLMIRAAAPTPGRNAPCPCGSGKKYKKCCLPADERARGGCD